MTEPQSALRREMAVGFAMLALLGGIGLYWGLKTELDVAVVASGVIVVESNVKKVQHDTIGTVGSIHVRDGQRVEKGAVVVRLDDTQLKAALGIVVNDLVTQRLRLERLRSERVGNAQFKAPPDIEALARDKPEIASVIEVERRVHATRIATMTGRKAQLDQRMAQSRHDIKALEEQQTSAARQLRIARDELKGLRPLIAQYLVPKTRISGLEREIARNEGAIAESKAKIAQARARIDETQLQVRQLEDDHQVEVARELSDIETRIGELTERRTSAAAQLERIEIRAPISGVVHQLAVHTVGGVISQSEPLMMIVPEDDRLVVEARIAPQDIEGVQPGLPVRVRFSAFNMPTTPEVPGILSRVSGDILREPQTGNAYYLIGVTVAAVEKDTLAGLRLLPGMPAEVFVRTGQRSPLSFLVKPLLDNMQRAMLEK